MPEPPVSRRNALLGLSGIAGAGVVDAFGFEPRWLDVTEHDVPVARLPRALSGFRVAQVTGAHLGELGAVEESILSGWYETAAGPAYVSRGTGTSIAPVRFTCRPELPILRLTQG